MVLAGSGVAFVLLIAAASGLNFAVAATERVVPQLGRPSKMGKGIADFCKKNFPSFNLIN